MTPALNTDDGSPAIAKSQATSASTARQEAHYSEQERTALLFMLEDLERSRKKIKQAHYEWISAMDTIHDPIFMHDKNYRVIRSNRAYAERAGMSVKEVVGKLYWEVFPKLDGPLPHCCKALQAEEEEEEEIQLAGGDIFVSRSFSVRNGDGNYLYSLHVMEDISERKRMQQTLQESEEKFRQISATAQDAILMMDNAGRIVFWNSAAEKTFGYTAEEALGKELHTLIVPERFREAFYKNFPPFLATGSGAVVGKTLELSAFGKTRPEFPVELSVSAVMLGDQWNAAGFIRDISERKRMQQTLQESEEKFRSLVETTSDWIWKINEQGVYTYASPQVYDLLGYTPKEIIGKTPFDLMPPEEATRVTAIFSPIMAEKRSFQSLENANLHKDGRMVILETSGVPILDSGGVFRGYNGIDRDITERKQADEELRLRAQILDSTSDTIFLLDLDGNFVYLNEAAWKSRGYTRDEMMGINMHALDTPEHAKIIETRFREVMEKGHCIFESAHRRKDGSVMSVEISARLIETDGRKLVLSVIRDITERKQAEQAQRESENLYHSLFENMLNGFAYCQMIFEQDQPHDFIYLSVNAAFETLTGLKNVAGKRVSEVIPGIRQSDPRLIDTYGRVSLSGKPERFEIYVEALQQWFWISVYSPERGYFVVVFDVITKRKQSEQALLKLNRAFRTLSAGNHELVHADDEQKLLQAMCHVIVESGGYSAAWVGYRQDDAEKSIRPMAECGFDPGYMDMLQITWADSERGHGPTGKAVRSGATQVVQDVTSDPDCAPWREQALKRGQASSIALPLLDNGEVLGSLTIYAAEANAFNQSEITLLEEMAGDLAFGIRVLRLRQEQQRSAEQVRIGLEGTIQAVAGMVEMRDPYTAGHQRRVTQLAAAIAAEMGLPEGQVRGIHLAGTIHDLGKIQTPAEILSKPGKLSVSEFGLIKDHPKNGYEILKDIDFPWPIAQMVLQHHEKLDGSGYPQGLQGNEILLEARIMTVADVVEAMSSHRPYRPGLGMDVALAEICKGRGTHYDPAAVDVCVRLFREKGFEFE